jgi:AraC-like DNA-binding protein
MILHSTFEIEKGETLQTGINSVVCDDRGGLWLGSARGGVLKADTIYENPSYTLYIISVLFGLSLLFVMINFYRYATRQQRKERMLMKRIQELVALQSFSETSSEIEDKDAGYIQSREQEKEESHEQVSEADAEFLARAISLVEQHLHTSGYTVERLAADLCMERTGLYRKLSTLVNQSPTLFMRRIRMKRAAQMLLEGKMSIVEVAERTGFSSASYFSKLFQEAYGCKPSEYRGEAK